MKGADLLALSLLLLLVLILQSCETELQASPASNVTSLPSSCTVPLAKCPRTNREVRGRLMCMYFSFRCPDENSYYFCGIDPDTNLRAEGCFPRHMCAAGSTNAIRVTFSSNQTIVSLQCVQCDKEHIQQSEHDSSMRFNSECDSPRMTPDFKNKLHTMMLINTGWPTKYDLYACDYTQGYSNIYKTTLCDVTTFCICRKNVNCTDGDKPVLLSNGQCDAHCSRKRDPYKDFACPSGGFSSATPSKPSTESVNASTTTESSDSGVVDDEPEPENQPGQSLLTVIILGVSLPILGLLYFLYRYRLNILSSGAACLAWLKRCDRQVLEPNNNQGQPQRHPPGIKFIEKNEQKIQMNGKNNVVNCYYTNTPKEEQIPLNVAGDNGTDIVVHVDAGYDQFPTQKMRTLNFPNDLPT